MRLDLSLSQRPEMQLRLSPQLIQRIEILQLPSTELLELVEQECADNETLEVEAPRVEVPEPSENGKEAEVDEEVAARIEEFTRYSEVMRPPRPTGDGERDPKMEAMANAAVETVTLRDHLLEQIRFATLPDKVREFAEILVDHLDENGFLPDPIEEVVIPYDDRFTLEEARDALEFLKTLDPPGVAARDLVECFSTQLDPNHPNYELHRTLVRDHLEDWRDNRLPHIARATGRSIEEIKAAMEELKHILRPPPGRLFRHDVVVPIRPDVVVEKVDGEYQVRLEERYYPHVSISPVALELYRDRAVTGKQRRELKGKLERARFLIEAIEQRKNTLYRVAVEIVNRQRDFFETGRLRPLKMRDVADVLGLHVSTVSRAISDKYMQTPRGIFSLKHFFTGAAPGGDAAGLESRDSVRQKVAEIIESEDKSRPYSDEEIVERLREQGLEIARRTVTKYRKMMNIPSSRQRRVY